MARRAAPNAPLPVLLSEPDSGLARRVHEGDSAAFEVLVARHRDALERFCRALLRHQEDAEDALQATLLRAYRGLARAERPPRVGPWMLGIARNECLRVAGARAATEPLDGEPAVEARLPEQVAAREELRRLGGDLRALPEGQRTALVLREMLGLPARQVAEVIGVPPGSVRRLVHDARRSLETFDAGRELGCEDVRAMIAGGDARRMRARPVGAHLRACAGCREAWAGARRRRGVAALLPPLPALAGRWAGAKLTAGTIAGVAVVSGVIVAGGLELPSGGGAAPAARAPAAAPPPTPASGPAPATVAVAERRASPKDAPEPGPEDRPEPRPATVPDAPTPAPVPPGEVAPAPPAPAAAGSPAPAAPVAGPAAAPVATPAVSAAVTTPAVQVAVAASPSSGLSAGVATPPVQASATVSPAAQVRASAGVTTPALPVVPVAPVTATAQVAVDPAAASAAVGAALATGGLLPPVRVSLP